MNKFLGKTVIVTGSASGIGEASAMLLARQGASVVIADMNEENSNRVAAAITDAGGTAITQILDISDEEAVKGMVAETLNIFGHIDSLVNCAALTSPQYTNRDLTVADMDVELWDMNMAVNLRGPMLCCKHVLPHMIDIGGGSIVNVSSVASRFGAFGQFAYGVTKAGIETMTLYVARQYGKQNIRCNAIVCSMTRTPALMPMTKQVEDILKNGICTPDFAEPSNVADAISFLLSDEAKCITGVSLPVDNGYSVLTAAECVINYAYSSGQIK